MKLRIVDKLRIKKQRDIALLQDVLVSLVYSVFPNAVLHGGTSVWRCYGGSRFSEDVNFYLEKNEELLGVLKNRISSKGFVVRKFKISDNALYSKIVFNNVVVRVEASFLKKSGIIRDFELCEGGFMKVFSLSAEELVLEKVAAYLSRFLVRDLYDISVLLPYVRDKNKVSNRLKFLLKNFKSPVDEGVLKVLVFSGVAPSTKQMLEYIRRWLK